MPVPNIEILQINDKEETPQSTEPEIPHERRIVEAVIKLWKDDSANEDLGIGKLHLLVKNDHPNWSLSEKRLKTVLKSYNLLNSAQQYTYANEITSKETPDINLPKNIRLQFTKNRGKGLYSTNLFKEGDLIWEEKTPLFFIPPLDRVNLIANSKACTYCGSLISSNNSSRSVLKGLDCNVCRDVWCSQFCKKNDKVHQLLKHNVYHDDPKKQNSKKQIISSNWIKYEKFCQENKWNAAFAIGLIHSYIITDKSGVLAKQFDAMAKVRQDIRYKAIDSSGIGASFDNNNNGGGALFVKEQQESLWKQGFELFNSIFPINQISYEEFLTNLGTYNINNIDGSLFLIQSHLNHNCDPNVRVKFGEKKTDGIKVYAKRDIKANEELTTSYVNPSHSLNQRLRELRVNWGFICNCKKCKDDSKIIQRKKSNEASSNQSKADVKKFLNENHDGEEFEIETPIINGEERSRRKSVRFDEKVVAVNNES
ncbi:lysine methyltransferase [Wickerhamomyces ciferrii]|uniref:Histone-lysine N-methyltransferase SET5 n=1 Tax=Wickerhamomyces ciferrii (strain ATCC 14091 / BCRC 22168 / CBS 111 / JCM 3599 / NBRC 0793 / NRRL Y-1031 F-60-10) TaxID=1206466 RepID=K0KME3_WICCF|nr:lysine methyltransferase [Wickerhamomyces ciferrii]CCH42549.1 lysine methyltransferase [Wickerhamomyces ciferrii]